MNKNVALVIVSVILLGMGLITYNEYSSSGKLLGSPPMPPNHNKSAEIKPNTDASKTKPAVPETKDKPVETKQVAVNKTDTASQDQQPTVPQNTQGAQTQQTQVADIPTTKPVEQELSKPVPTIPVNTPVTPEQYSQGPIVSNDAAEKKSAALENIDTNVQPAVPYNEEETKPVVTPPAEPKPAAETSQNERVIRKISVLNIGDGVTIRFDSNKMPTYHYSHLNSPERLVVDLDGAWKIRPQGAGKNPFVSNIRIGEHREGTRIVFDLQKAPSSIRFLKYGTTGLDIRLR